MADVFISYAREDRPAAQQLAKLVEASGYTVWWDRELAPGNAYAEIIEGELDNARAVIVIWSQASRASQWVRDEAAVGRDRNRLVPIAADASVTPPLGFRQLHTVTMADVQSEQRTRTALMTSLATLCGRIPSEPAPRIAESRPAAPAPPPAPRQTIDRPIEQILAEEKRQRNFVGSFWLTSFLVSAVVAGLLTLLAQYTVRDANTPVGIVALGSFMWMSVALILGRFLIVIGRRLSKRKSVRYFDMPTLICLGISILIGLSILGDQTQAFNDRIFFVPLLASFVFPFFALVSIIIGVVAGASRTTFAEGR